MSVFLCAKGGRVLALVVVLALIIPAILCFSMVQAGKQADRQIEKLLGNEKK